MRVANTKHCLGVVRKITGLGQKELAALIGKSPKKIAALENMRDCRLTDEEVRIIADYVGVDYMWLRNGDASVEPKRGLSVLWAAVIPGAPRFDRRYFSTHRALSELQIGEAVVQELDSFFRDLTPEERKAKAELFLSQTFSIPLATAKPRLPLAQAMLMLGQSRWFKEHSDKYLLELLNYILVRTGETAAANYTRLKVLTCLKELSDKHELHVPYLISSTQTTAPKNNQG